ncbi:transposase InsO family protein [Sphingomonas zeicaulis]
MSFIDVHREELGIEPICRELAIAPSSYHEHATRLADPAKRSARARRDDDMCEQIRRVHEASFGLYGSRKVWHQLRREGLHVAKCTVERLMRSMAETINGLYKAEVIWRQRSWPSASAVEMATLSWVDWYNNHRLFGPLGYIPPAEAEANYYAAIETLDMAA